MSVNDDAQAARDRWDTRKQAEDAFLARPLRPVPPIDFSRVSTWEREHPRPDPDNLEGAHPMHLSDISITDTDGFADLHMRFAGVRAEHAEALADFAAGLKKATADGRITAEESATILIEVLALLNPDLAARLAPLEMTVKMALRDGRIDMREGFAIALGLVTAF